MDARTLRPYQEMMIDHIIAHPKGHLFAGMGIGKTVATLTAIDRMLLAGMIDGPVLVLAPLRVARDVWPTEVREWAHLDGLRVVPIIGTESERRAALHKKADIFTCNYENLVWLCETWGSHWPYRMVVCDEVSKIKSLRASIRTNKDGTSFVAGQGGARAKILLKTVYHHKVERFIGLTGTPSANGLEDLWGIMFPVDYGKRLGRTFSAFQARWFQRSFNGFGYEPLPHAQGEIQEAIKDICLSLRSEDYFDLEEPIVRTITVDLPPAVRKAYREMERTLYTEICATPLEAFNSGAKTQKLLQFCNGAAYTGNASDPGKRNWVDIHDEKLKVLEEIVEEASGEPLLVGYSLKSDLARILARFPKAVHFSHTPGILERWNKGKIPMLVAHAASMGHGLSLQHGGCRLVRFSTDWNNEQFDQLLERLGPTRQKQSGYNRNVWEYRIVVKNSIDEDVYESHATKKSVQDCLMEGLGRRSHGL